MRRAYVGSNRVWHFEFSEEHLVRLGDYITCTCGRDWECPHLRQVVQRVWDLAENENILRYMMINANRMPSITCPICLDSSPWRDRGSDFSFCVQCLRVFHKACLIDYGKKQRQPACPMCRKTNDFLPEGHSITDQWVYEETNTTDPMDEEAKCNQIDDTEKTSFCASTPPPPECEEEEEPSDEYLERCYGEVDPPHLAGVLPAGQTNPPLSDYKRTELNEETKKAVHKLFFSSSSSSIAS